MKRIEKLKMVNDTAGLFPEVDRLQFELAGKEIRRRFDNAVAETSGKRNSKFKNRQTANNH